MSFHAVSAVFAHSASQHDCRLTLLALAEHASDDGIAWPAQETIAERAFISTRSVRRCLRSLAELGEIEVRQVQAGRRRFNVYRLLLPGIREPDYGRLERQGLELSAPFTSGQIGRSSERDDRTDATGTGGQSVQRAPLYRGNRHGNRHDVVDATDEDGNPVEAILEHEDDFDSLISNLDPSPTQRTRWLSAYHEDDTQFARAREHANLGHTPAGLLDHFITTGKWRQFHHRGLTPTEIEQLGHDLAAGAFDAAAAVSEDAARVCGREEPA